MSGVGAFIRRQGDAGRFHLFGREGGPRVRRQDIVQYDVAMGDVRDDLTRRRLGWVAGPDPAKSAGGAALTVIVGAV